MVLAWFTVLLSLLLVYPEGEDHAVYLSTVYVDVEETVVIAEVRVFEDDLRAVIQDHTGEVTDTTALRFRDDVLSYFRKYLVLQSAEDYLEWSLDRLTLVGDSYQVHLIAKPINPSLSGTWELKASYFFELFPTQKNVLRFRDGSQKLYHTFTKKDDSFKIKT